MNRNDEYCELLNELNETPLKLDYTLERAQVMRVAKKRRARKAIIAPIGSLAAVIAVFVLLVNVSPTFAFAAGHIPYLRDLAQFVAMSPSLSAAVENEYVQPIDLEETANGITAKVEYVIVDQKQLNIFYTLDSDTYTVMDASPEFRNSDDTLLSECGISYGSLDIKNGELCKITVDFSTASMPNFIKLKLNIRDIGTLTRDEPIQNSDDDMLTEYEYEEPVYIAELDFALSLDPYYTAKGEELALNKNLTIDNQKLTLTAAEIYPTQMRFNFDDNESNTAWMKSLEFYVENEKGERFEGISNGISAFGKVDSPMMKTYILESAFFSESEHLTLCITGVTWLDMDMEKIRVNLGDKVSESMPDNVEFEFAKKMKNGWVLIFSAPFYEENTHYQLWDWTYYDADGTEYDFNGMSSSNGGYYDSIENVCVNLPDRFVEEFALVNYPYDEVWLRPAYSRRVTLDTPINIDIK